VVFVQSSLSVIATAMTAPDVIRISGPEIENFDSSGLSKASMALRMTVPRSALDHFACRPALDGVLRVLNPLQVAQALGDDCGDGRERVLDAVVQLFEDQLLQLVGCLALSGSIPASASRLLVLISACARSSRRLTFSAARKSWWDSAPPGRLSVRRSTSSICNCITLDWVPHLIFSRAVALRILAVSDAKITGLRRGQSCCESGL
jgi:hypothetical protein